MNYILKIRRKPVGPFTSSKEKTVNYYATREEAVEASKEWEERNFVTIYKAV